MTQRLLLLTGTCLIAGAAADRKLEAGSANRSATILDSDSATAVFISWLILAAGSRALRFDKRGDNKQGLGVGTYQRRG